MSYGASAHDASRLVSSYAARITRKESAFESAAAAAALAIRQGHEVHLTVPGRQPGQSALGD
jgi:uncharacterized protein (DUF58 family)